ncbi:MAG: hypothetical protein BZ138_06965, partial [Methanosphaera sp. rholeuAM270]
MSAHATKFLYPLIIAPALATFHSLDDQLAAINVINSVLVAATVFPAAALVYRLFSGKHSVIMVAFAAVAAFLPDSFYSIGMMAEPLALPLAFGWLYFLYVFFSSDNSSSRSGTVVILGIMAFLLYACKEHFVVYVAAFVVVCAIKTVLHVKGKVGNAEVRQIVLGAVSDIALFFGVAALLTVASQAAVFGTIPNNAYNNQLDILDELAGIEPQRVCIFIGVLAAHIIAMSGFIPLFFLPWRRSRSWEGPGVSLALFAAVALVLMGVVVLLTIMIQEDGMPARFIARYYTPLAFVLIACTVAKLVGASSDELSSMMQKHGMVGLLVACVAIALALGYCSCDYEPTGLFWLTCLISGNFSPSGGAVPPVLPVVVARVLIIAALLVLAFAVQKGKVGGRVLSAVFTGLFLVAWGFSACIMANCMHNAHVLDDADR